jgi:hypothetical protein
MAVSTGAAILGAAGIGAVTGLLGGKQSSDAAKSAAQTQADAANQATAAQNAALQQQLALQQPFTTAGTTAVNQLSALTQPGGRLTQDFAYQPFNYQADPGYAFRMKEGMNAMNATAAARGGLISGNALKAGQVYGQEMGSQEYQNSFNRYLQNYANSQNTYQMNRNNLINPLQYLSSVGQAGASNQAGNVGSFGTSQAANITGGANALAAGQIGSANAYNTALGSVGNAAQMGAMMNMYGNRNTSAYGSPSGGVFGSADANAYGPGWSSTGYSGNN